MTPPSPRAAAAVVPGMVSIIGMNFSIAPVLIGVSSAFLVRLPLIKSHRAGLLQELTWTALAMLGAFVTIMDQKIGPGPAFWLGMGYGAIASSLNEVAKSAIVGGVQTRVQAAVRALLGLKEPEK